MCKSKLISLAIGLLLVTLPFVVSADLQFRVTKVQAWVKEPNFKGECPHTFEFEAAITVNKAGTVKYKWVQSHNQVAAKIRTLDFLGKGTKIVKSKWILGRMGRKYTNYWKKVEVIAPNSMVSNRANFNLECTVTTKPLASIELFPYKIRGSVNSGHDPSCSLAGRKVIIKLKQGSSTIGTLEKSLESASGFNSRLEYTFKVRFTGTYQIWIEKGPPDYDNYTCTANVCWQGITPPIYKSVVVTETQKEYSVDPFVIEWAIRVGGGGLCWIP
jgi:hypothetical protein